MFSFSRLCTLDFQSHVSRIDFTTSILFVTFKTKRVNTSKDEPLAKTLIFFVYYILSTI